VSTFCFQQGIDPSLAAIAPEPNSISFDRRSQPWREGSGFFLREQLLDLLALVCVGNPEKQISKPRRIMPVFETLHCGLLVDIRSGLSF
jgi:hypothetical protein